MSKGMLLFFCFFANKCVVQATARDGGQSDYLTYFGGNGTGAAKELAKTLHPSSIPWKPLCLSAFRANR